MMMKHLFLILVLGFLSTFQVQAQKSEVFLVDGKALRGYDPVAFFTKEEAVKGVDSLTWTWKEAVWYFSSPENKALFMAQPEKYAPQYGGYCAYGMSEGHKAPTEIDTWTLHEGKLYFNYNKKVKSLWVKDKEGHIKKADANWPGLKNKE